jgi:Fe-S cluster assembly protein SufD
MARAVAAKSSAEIALAEEFAASKAGLPGGRAVADARAAAIARFERAGLPSRRIEQWKYTDLRALMRSAKPLAPPPSHAAKEHARSAGAIVSGVPAQRMIFVDGAFVPELSDTASESGVTTSSLAAAITIGDAEIAARLADAAKIASEDTALALNTAMMRDGAVIRVVKNAAVARPIHLIFVHSAGAATATFNRSQVVIGAGAHVTLLESHEGPESVDYQSNTALDLIVGDGAHVDHIKIACEGGTALHVATMTAQIGARAHVRSFGFTMGGGVTRNQVFVRCAGDRSEVTFAGAALLRGRSHSDTTIVLDHVAGGCRSREIYKSVLEDQTRGVFQGRIVVRPGAQKTNARMLMQALLLSEHAEADHKPELEIFADDVECGHGSTAGELDENLKFYLMARGISEKEAETLLIQAFVGEAIETIAHEGLRDALMFATVRWLGQRS